MASDEDDDLLALREAALATMKKKPAAEDAQPIPQLTTSGHSLTNARPSWVENDFAYDDHVPFQDHEPAGPFPPLNTLPPQFNHPLPVQFPQNNWPGPRPAGMVPVHRGNFTRFGHNRGPFPPNQRGGPFGQNKHPRFGKRVPFLPNQRQPFPPNQQLPFNMNQPPRPRPPFGQDPAQFGAGPPPGAGNLIVINTVPVGGFQQPVFFGQRPPYQSNVRPRGRGGVRPGAEVSLGNGGGAGQGGNPPSAESPSKPLLLRPQDKYCPPADRDRATQEKPKEPVHRKKKDKFSRYNSSDDDSDDESEEESETELPSRRRSVGGRETEEKEVTGSEDVKEDSTFQSQSDKSIPEAELSITAMNSSQVDSDQELEEPVIDSLSEPVIDNISEPVIGNLDDGKQESEPELDEEEENRLLASPSRQSGSGSNHIDRLNSQRNSSEDEGTPTRDESPVLCNSPVRNESPVREASSGSATPVKDESFDKDVEASSIRDESPERDVPPERTESPEKENADRNKLSSSHQSRKGEKDSQSGESDSDNNSDGENDSDGENNSDGENDSDSSSDSSSSGSSSGKETASKSGSNSASEGSEGNKAAESSEVDSDSVVQVADEVSDSESDEDMRVRRLPSKNTLPSNSRQKRTPSPTKPVSVSRPEEQARIEARRRKFENREEVKVAGSKRTISLKGITTSSKRSKDSNRQNNEMVKNSQTTRSGSRTVQRKTSVTKSTNDIDFHHKHSRRKVSIEKPSSDKSDNNSEAENKSESDDDDDEDGGSRAWMREANRNAVRRKTVINKSLPDSGRYRNQPYRGGNRNGGYYRRERESLRANQPEAHYSSSDDDVKDNDRKLISIVVPRSAAGTHHGYNHPRQEASMKRSFVPNRKRTSKMSSALDHESERHSHSKSKRSHEASLSSNRTENISVVIAGDHSPPTVSQPSGGRVSVHQRLGKGNKRQTESTRSQVSKRPAARNQADPASGNEGNRDELDQRIRVIQRKNKAIMRRQKEVLKDRELYG